MTTFLSESIPPFGRRRNPLLAGSGRTSLRPLIEDGSGSDAAVG